jgi:kinetochore protein Mis12/MTW1
MFTERGRGTGELGEVGALRGELNTGHAGSGQLPALHAQRRATTERIKLLTRYIQNLQPPCKDSKLTPDALFTLRRKLIETKKLNEALVAEKNRNDAQIARLRALLQPRAPKREPRSSNSPAKQTNGSGNGDASFAFLTHTPAAQALGVQPLPQASNTTSGPRTPLTTHTTFTTSQLPYLRQLLSSLQPHLATTALPTSTSSTKNSDEMTKERKVYLESQSKRILERRGVDTKDGVEGVWEGRRVGAEEVRGLEGLVQVLERGKAQDVRMEGTDAAAVEAEDGEAMDTS